MSNSELLHPSSPSAAMSATTGSCLSKGARRSLVPHVKSFEKCFRYSEVSQKGVILSVFSWQMKLFRGILKILCGQIVSTL